MAMEGKTAACAHLSPLGNIAAATCDTWLDRLQKALESLSSTQTEFIGHMTARVDTARFVPADYALT